MRAEKYNAKLSAYHADPYVGTIKHLVAVSSDHSWSGTATSLRVEATKFTGQSRLETSVSVGKTIAKYTKLLKTDGIIHTVKKSNIRTHTFTRR